MTPNVFPIYARDFIDRRLECAFLTERWHAAIAGNGSFVLIEGEAGVGKSRLIAEFGHGIDGVVARSACLPYATAPFAPIAEVLRELIRAFPGCAPPAAYLRTVLRTIVPDIGPPHEIVRSDSALVRRWMLDAIAETFARLSATKPALAIIEDLHWADTDTLAAMSYLASKLEHLRVVLLGSYRYEPGEAKPAFSDFINASLRLRQTCTLTVRELDEKDSRALVSTAVPAGLRLSPVDVDRICRRSGGNPLFLEELIKHTLDRRGEPAALPRTIESLLRDRLASFSAGDLRVLAIAGALSGRFTAGEIASTASLDPGVVVAALQRALRQNILTLFPGETDQYDFRNHLMREVTYEMLDKPSALAIHRAVAQRLEAAAGHADVAALSYHWYKSGDRQRALRYGISAGDAAAAAYAYERAIEEYGAILPLAEDERTRSDLRAKLSRMLKNAGAAEEAIKESELAAHGYQELGDREALAETLVGLSAMRAREWSERSITDAESALAAAGNDASNRWGFAAHVRLAETLFMRGQIERSRAHLAAAAPYVDAGKQRHVALFHQVRSWLAFNDGDPACISMALEAVAIARAINNVENLPGMCTNAATMAMERGEPAIAAAELEAAIEASDYYRLPALATYARITYATFLTEYGSLTQAAAVIRALGAPPLEARWLSAAASSAALRIALATSDAGLIARWDAGELLDISRKSGEATRFGPHAGAHAQLAASRRDDIEAYRLLAEAVEMMPDAHGNHYTLLCVAELGFAPRIPRAREVLVSTAERWNVARSRAYLHLFDAFAADGARDRAEHARLAIKLFEPLRILLALGQAHELAGDPAAAARLYLQCGATRLSSLLARSDSKDHLSKREDQIAGLIGQGMTNKEIALKLGLSDRTVENHVASILRKLKLRSRTQIATRVVSQSRKTV